ncbi:MobA/MobL family protein [Agrobacterium tumefaciens]|uniref:MobA/MobL protein domain-containing protein n=1 Tax=Agrobacterium tumefaciens TaxID=358 RepID=A0A176WW55_AGRTU|nr:MobA/MobL family protein [Agrobacterium tumefaciens]OAE37625.1 hypothetical protein A7J57_08590 [Agrobacterium tumefaciens]
MAQAAYFRIEHASYNRGEWGYGRVANAAHYAANQNKRGHVATVGLPIFRTSYDAKMAFLALEKQATRKNARLGDTLIVSLPNQVAPEHRIIMMERFLSRITFNGQTYAQAWEHNDKPDNPHFHVVLIDRDRITGKSVGKFGHSRSYRAKQGLEPNVTEWMRKQWEETGNEVFAEFGYGLTFDRRSNLERGLEPAERHRGYANDNPSVDEVSQNIPTSTEDAGDSDEDMDTSEKEGLTHAAIGVDPVGTIKFLHDQKANLEHLHRAKERIETAEKRYAWLVEQREKVSAEAGDYYQESQHVLYKNHQLQEQLSQYQREDGSLKGKSLSLFGVTLFKTSARKEAERVQVSAQEYQALATDAEHTRRSYDRELHRLSENASQAERDAFMYRRELEAVYGVEEEVEAAEKLLLYGIRDAASSVTLEEAHAAYQAGDITYDEYRTFLMEGGYHAELQAMDNGQSL